MTQNECNIDWRIDAAERGSDRPFGLLIEVTANDPDADRVMVPLNVGLAIDRSGSMHGPPIDAAKRAARGVIDSLGPNDFVTLATFESEATALVSGLAMTRSNKQRSQREVMAIRSAGATALFDGWREAALGVANAVVGPEVLSLVVMLSDGMGNRGLTRPADLRRHAAELTRRGIRSSCVGIGAHYSTPQLAAIADGGEGLLHHASEPEEIIEVVLGEVDRQRRVVADDVSVTIEIPAEHTVRVCGGRGSSRRGNTLEVFVGGLAGGQTVQIALLFDQVEASASDLYMDTSLAWTSAATGAAQRREATIDLRSAGEATAARDVETAAEIASLWHAELCRRAMEFNDLDRFEDAFASIRDEQAAFVAYVRDLHECEPLLSTLSRVAERSRRRWQGRSKKEAYIMTSKRSRSDQDLRCAAKDFDLSDILDA